ncbi:hypothetical protein ScPMuIL_016215 [Solemya velum]
MRFYNFLFHLAISVVGVSGWTAETYWNSRYGTTYTADDSQNGMWSDDSSLHYLLPPTGGVFCTGCSCPDHIILEKCQSSSVSVEGQSFPSVSNDTFDAGVTSISILSCPVFSVFGEKTFDHLSGLTRLIIQQTGIEEVPDVSQTAIQILNLANNQIKITAVNLRGWSLPSTITHLALMNNQISWLPENFISGPNLRVVSLSGNQLRYFPRNAFTPGSTPNLIYLGLDGNQIQMVSARHLFPLAISPDFMHLNLSNNVLTYIEPAALSTLQSLKILELHRNSISSIYWQEFNGIPALLHLDLHQNELSELISKSFVNLQKLTELRLHSQKTPMTKIAFDAFVDIGAELKNLFVSDNSLTTFPHQVLQEGSYPKLQYMYADHNLIKNVSEFGEEAFPVSKRVHYQEKLTTFKPFETTPNIKVLYLDSNRITSVNVDYCMLLSLKILYLDSNLITEDSIHPEAFQCLPSLTNLYLPFNLIQYVPEALQSNSSLRVITDLDLSFNKLTFLLAGTFSRLETLQTLELSSNGILAIENDAFPDQLVTLTLQNNDLDFLHGEPFKNLGLLLTLSLSNNRIDYLPETIFYNCTSLTTLDLSFNQIPQILKSHLENCPLTFAVYLQNNDIGWIEDEAFAHILQTSYIYLQGNRLSELSGGFSDLSVFQSLSLSSNRITKLSTGVFSNVQTQSMILSGNKISTIEGGAFQSVSVSQSITFSGNPLRDLHPYSFNMTSCGDLILSSMQLSSIPPHAFSSVRVTYALNLAGNSISNIHQDAFYNLQVGSLFLSSNELEFLNGKIFGGNSNVAYLYLYSNKIGSIAADAFENLAVTEVNLQQNKMTLYPLALATVNPQIIYIQDNEITYLPPGSFAGQTSLRILNLSNNKLTVIEAGIFNMLTGLQQLFLQSNNIEQIQVGAFDNLVQLTLLQLDNNQLHHLPAFPELLALQKISVATNVIGSLDHKTFGELPKLNSLDLSANPLGCECNTVNSLDDLAQMGISIHADCGSPVDVATVTFDSSMTKDPTYYTNISPTLFQCTGSNLQVTSVSASTLNLEWNRPDSLYVYIISANDSSNSTSYNQTTAPPSTGPWDYIVKCDSSLGSVTDVVTGDDTTLSAAFDQTDGILPGTMYNCYVKLRVDGYTSAASNPVIQWTPSLAVGNLTVDTNDIPLTFQYYDFSTAHPDFDGVNSILVTSPIYIPSPYGAWLAVLNTPTADSFSDWFRYVPGTNEVFEQTVVLELQSGLHQYYSDSFFPVDGKGYESQGQTDCSGDLHNFGFTSAVRVGLEFTGREKLTVGGGEELWLYINKVLVLEVIADLNGGPLPCQKIDLSPASSTGGGEMVPEVGVIIGGICTGLHPSPAAAFNLELEKNQVYHFDLFHTERHLCKSQLLIQTENTKLIDLKTSANQNSNNRSIPVDYSIKVFEDFHVDGILEVIHLADVFSIGPTFDVKLEAGNEARHFTLKDNTAANEAAAVAPPSTSPTYTKIAGVPDSFISCAGAASITPEPNLLTPQPFVLTTPTALLTLSSLVDYEVATEYSLTIEVVDRGATPILTGTIGIWIRIEDVNDNCPILSQTEYTVTPVPVMQLSSLLTVIATDVDSGQNGILSYYLSTVTEEPPVNYDQSMDLYKSVYPNSTDLMLQIVVLDNGTPRRGAAANINVTVSNTCVVSASFKRIQYTLIVDNTTGNFFLRIPKYWVKKYECKDYTGIAKGYVRDEQLTASSQKNDFTKSYRGRLNNTANPALDIGGGWVAGVNDKNQYFQVDMEVPYKYTKIHLQGVDGEPKWITSFRVFYTNNDTGPWTLYSNNASNTIFSANQDEDTVVDIELNPPILSRYIRLNPWTWSGGIGLRLELSGCKQSVQRKYDTSCERCYTTWYCEGDGERRPCGRCEAGEVGPCTVNPYEHSFGLASSCSPCPVGWICHEGYAKPCPSLHHAECNESFCPSACEACKAGRSCLGGRTHLCGIGTFSTSDMEFCESCKGGTYQDELGQSSCKQCPAGHQSTPKSDRCSVCSPSMYSTAGSLCAPCAGVSECPCLDNSKCFKGTACVNTGSGGHQCLECPPGYQGDGTNCVDINECDLYHPCWNSTACVNTNPGYQCLACPPGYSGTYEDALAWNDTNRVFELRNQALAKFQYQTCSDIDECADSNGGCDVHSKCTNTVGSFVCGSCEEGYVGSSDYGCFPADFCSFGKHNCINTTECVYLGPGLYKCECKEGYAGTGKYCGIDTDLDGHPDISLECADWGCKMDNCKYIPNSGQEDVDGDQMGDLCDDDDDNDGFSDSRDNCQYVKNMGQADGDGDGIGDDCDLCPSDQTMDQTDTDGDGVGDFCDPDDDGDGILDNSDNCPLVANPTQDNSDTDSLGDACDNCVNFDNDYQTDTDQNGFGDACDVPGANSQDRDGDGVLDFADNCPDVPNADQADTDADSTGDACDGDIDGDSYSNDQDNCPYYPNLSQQDLNADHVGDDCEEDTDMDGVTNDNDTCPINKFISVTSFEQNFGVTLDPSMTGTKPDWIITARGIQISQNAESEIPVMLIGDQRYGAIEYSGTWYVNSDKGDNYIGFVFGYVSNRKFYAVIWRGDNQNYGGGAYRGGIKGPQIKLVDSATGPSSTLSNAIWHSADTADQVTLLWHEPSMTGWKHFTAYRWHLSHQPSTGRMRLLVYNGLNLLADSGNVYDTRISGGRVGVLSFNQAHVIWSNLHVLCLENENKAMFLDGADDYVKMSNVSDMGIQLSFSFTSWLFLETGYPLTPLPIFCTLSGLICLWVESRALHGVYGTKNVTSTTILPAETWHHVMFRYDGQEETLTLFLNGADTLSIPVYESQEIDVSHILWSNNSTDEDTILYLGRGSSSFFRGYLDEVRIFGIAIPDDEVNSHLQLATMDRAKLQGYVNIYYTMDEEQGVTTLADSGLLKVNGQIFGKPKFIEVNITSHSK